VQDGRVGVAAAAGLAAADVPRALTGPAPPPSRLLRIANATALQAGLDPGDLCGPAQHTARSAASHHPGPP
jgi:hypothetical protein